MTKQDTLPPPDERAAFEAWYAEDASKDHPGWMKPSDIFELREGDHYGDHRVMLNGKWAGWQARATLAAQALQQAQADPLWKAMGASSPEQWARFKDWQQSGEPQQAQGVTVIWSDAAICSLLRSAGDGPFGEEDIEVTRRFMVRAEEIRQELAAPQAAPTPQEAIEDPVTVPRSLLGSACAAIAHKRDAPNTLAQLQRYTAGDLSAPPAPAPQALTQLTDEQIAAAVRPLYRSDQAAKLGLDDDIRTVRAVFGIGAASAGGEG